MNETRKVYIMGIICGVILGMEKTSGLVVHQQLSWDVCQTAHCTYNEMIDAMNDLVHYSDVVKHFLEIRMELKKHD